MAEGTQASDPTDTNAVRIGGLAGVRILAPRFANRQSMVIQTHRSRSPGVVLSSVAVPINEGADGLTGAGGAITEVVVTEATDLRGGSRDSVVEVVILELPDLSRGSRGGAAVW